MTQNKYEDFGAIAVPATKQDKNKAYDHGEAICEFQRGKQAGENPVHAGRNYKETGPKFEAKSQLAEILVGRHLGLEDDYIGFQTEKDEYKKPDLGGFVEVRRTLDLCIPVSVFDKDVRAGALVVRTYYEDSTIYITGWEWAKYAWDSGMYLDRDARTKARLQPAATLKSTVEGVLRGETN